MYQNFMLGNSSAGFMIMGSGSGLSDDVKQV